MRKSHVEKKTAETLDNTGNAEIAQDYYINKSLDTKRHLKDTETDQLQNQVLLDNFVEIMKEDSINTFVPEKVLTSSRNAEIARREKNS